MARFVITSAPNEPRQGVFVIDADDEETARTRVMRDGEGDVVWSVNQPELNEGLLRSFGPVAQRRTRQVINRLQGEFGGAGSVMLRERPVTRITRAARQFAGQAALPVAGGVVGGIVSPFMGVPSPVGSAVGGGLGEVANQVLGITPEDTEQIVLAMATSGAGRGVGSLRQFPRVGPRVDLSRGAQRIPGSAGAFTEMATEQLRNVPTGIEFGTQAILGDETIDSLFDLALSQRGGSAIQVTNLRQAIRQGLTTEQRARDFGLQFGSINRILRQTGEQARQGGGALALRDMELLRKRIGARIGRLSVDGEQRNALRSLYRGIMQDLEAASGRQPEAAALLTAVRVARREFAARDFADFLEQRVFGPPRADGLRPVAIGRLKREFDIMLEGRPSRSFELFEDSLTRPEIEEIQGIINLWSDTLRPLPPPPGTQFGSGPTAAAGGLGFLLGGGTGAAGAVVAKNLLTRGLMSPTGRRALRNLLERSQTINLAELGLLLGGTAARQQLSPSRQLLERFQAPQISAPR